MTKNKQQVTSDNYKKQVTNAGDNMCTNYLSNNLAVTTITSGEYDFLNDNFLTWHVTYSAKYFLLT